MRQAVRLAISLLVLGLIALTPTSAVALPARPSPAVDDRPLFVGGEVLVKWREDVTAAAARAAVSLEGLVVLQEIASLGLSRVAVPPGLELAYAAELSDDPVVAYAEPNYLAYASGSDVAYPDDTYWTRQWNMRRIEAVPAWALSTGKPDLLVAVLDSGVDFSHPDLSGNLLPGHDFVNGDSNPTDDYGHGTHVTGILAAHLNNGLGVAGVAPLATVLPLKVLNDRGSGTYADIAAGITFAAANGADIINLSLGGDSPSAILQQAVLNASASGVLLVASAGNQGLGSVTYPARYDEVLAVAATDHYDLWPSYSNWGPEVDLAAPGGTGADQVWSTWPGGYGWKYGTSMAAPHVSGTAALLWSVQPALSASQITDILRQTADRVGQYTYTGGRNNYLGYGRVNAHRALRQALPPTLSVSPAQMVFLGDSQKAPVPQRLWLSNESRQPLQWQAEKTSGGSWLSLTPLSGSITYQDPDWLSGQVSTSNLGYGFYEGSVRISSPTPGAKGTPYSIPVYVSLVPSLSRVYLPAVASQHTHPQWVDITDGRQLSLGDEMSVTVSLPWSFPFFENRYDRAWVGDNGLVSFRRGYAGIATDGTPAYLNDCLPSARLPNDAIYAFWDDLNPTRGGAIFAKAVDDRTYVIEWLEVPHYDGSSPETFQVVLSSSGTITFQYLTVSDDSSVTVGVENYDGTAAWQWLCNQTGTGVRSGMAFSYKPPTP
jgi:subtilisin family serine protease